jgi:hypothetical protein
MGFMVADADESGALDEREFQMLIGYLLYFNNNRHQVDELHAYFKDGFDSDGFYTGCMIMGEPMGDDDAEEYFQRLCNKHHQAQPAVTLSFSQNMTPIGQED